MAPAVPRATGMCLCCQVPSVPLGRDVPLPSEARLIAFKNRVPRQKDLCFPLACWGFSSFPSVQRSFAIVAATGLGKTGKKKELKVSSKWGRLILGLCPDCAQFVSEPAAFSPLEIQVFNFPGENEWKLQWQSNAWKKETAALKYSQQHNFD